MQSVADTFSSASLFANGEEATTGPLTRAAAKRASQHEAMDHNKRRAAFEDITNQHKEVELQEKALAELERLEGGLQLQLQGNPLYGQVPGHCFQLAAAPGAALSLRSVPTHVDIDVEGATDVMACTEYANEIFLHLRNTELLRRPLVTYMESVQGDITPHMRSILVDWLVEVAQEYRLASDTLFLTVAYVDRFLSLVDVPRNKLQLVGVGCMLVASKYEEIYAPQIDEFCYITDNTYSREQVLEMERQVLHVLDFDLTQPTAKTFLRRYIKAASGEIPVDANYEFLCSYLAELSMIDYGAMRWLPSQVAASCVLLALFMLGKPAWSPTLRFYTGYVPGDLRDCVQALHEQFKSNKVSALPASREKYASPKLGVVSMLGTVESLPSWLWDA